MRRSQLLILELVIELISMPMTDRSIEDLQRLLERVLPVQLERSLHDAGFETSVGISALEEIRHIDAKSSGARDLTACGRSGRLSTLRRPSSATRSKNILRYMHS